MKTEIINDIKTKWNDDVKDTFDNYLSIPNVSPAFDSNWKQNGYIDEVANLFLNFADNHAPKNAKVFLQEIENKTPLLVIDVPAQNYKGDDTVLIYGHLDKQPKMTGWDEGIEPFSATYIGERVYGRGSSDDGYALFSALIALDSIDENTSRARTVVIIEASEESGSPDLVAHLEKLESSTETALGNVSLVVCLDSGCLTYEHFWITRSLRGLLQLNVSVKVLEQGMHSGAAGGIVPSAQHIMREFINRISEPGSGKILVEELYADIPQDIIESAQSVAKIIGDTKGHGLAFAQDVLPIHSDVASQIIANTYEPQLEIIGIDGVPAIKDAGNVLLPEVMYALSFRIPPGVDPNLAAAKITEKILEDIPYGAQVNVVVDSLASGWQAPKVQDWLANAIEQASQDYFSNTAQHMGEGGSIPFMAMLGEKYPDSQFVVTGVLGPGSNAHGPNEFLDLPTAYKVTASITDIIKAHGSR